MKNRSIDKRIVGFLMGVAALIFLAVHVGADDCEEAILIWDWYSWSWVCEVHSGGGQVCISCDEGSIDVYPDQNTP